MISLFKFGAFAIRGMLAGVCLYASVACFVPAATAAEGVSDKSVKVLMDYAWGLVPQQFTMPNGKTILVDKKKKEEILVPTDVAGEVIRVGRISALAQVCKLNEDQLNNYNSLMRREIEKKKWTDQQLLYISQLHLTTVMLLTGRIKLIDQEGGKDVVEVDSPTHLSCAPEQGAKVKEQIATYVKAGPPLLVGDPVGGATAAPAAAALPAATAAPAPVATKPAAQKK